MSLNYRPHKREKPFKNSNGSPLSSPHPAMNNLNFRLVNPSSLLHQRHREDWWRRIIDPSGEIVNQWNHFFLITSLVALFVDPLFFYLLYFEPVTNCFKMDAGLGGFVITTRSIVDLFSVLHIAMKFRTAYIAPNSRVFGRGELVLDPKLIAIRYLKGDFGIDLAAALPLPQVIGSIWYLMSVERTFSCWRQHCRRENGCSIRYLDCSDRGNEYYLWRNTTQVFSKCNAKINSPDFDFGMFADSWNDQVTSTNVLNKYFYCLWYGLRSLSSYGQSITTSTYIVETVFCSLICLMGLVFFSLLIGNVQSYLQSTSARLEEWRVQRRDTEEWMRHRQLPPKLQDRVRRFVQYNWLSNRGVNEEDILQELPLDMRREIQKHLCLDLVRRVSFFSQMDDQLLNAICERLVSSLNTKDTYIVREGDPVNEMLFIIRGQLESSTTDGGRSGFFNSITLKPGDFCGEELLTWALGATSNHNFPASTRTVKSTTEVEAFALRAEDLKFVANQFKRLHSMKLQHQFRYYSHQWRTWGACIVQAAWRRHRRRRLAEELARHESSYYMRVVDDEGENSDGYEDNIPSSAGNVNEKQLSTTLLVSKFAANTKKDTVQKVKKPGESSLRMPKLFKPDEPNFLEDQEDSKGSGNED